MVSADKARATAISDQLEQLGGVDVFTYPSCNDAYESLIEMIKGNILPAVVVTDAIAGEKMKGVAQASQMKSLGPRFSSIPVYMIANDNSKQLSRIPGVSAVFRNNSTDIIKNDNKSRTSAKNMVRYWEVKVSWF